MDDAALLRALAAVPAVTGFPTVDALTAAFERLAAEHPHAGLRRIGTSRLGEPLVSLTVGCGPVHAIVFGGVHPNEPVGGLTALHLARTLLADRGLCHRLGYTWHIIGCLDPDGMRLNEGWFAGPMTRGTYGRGFYRPAPDEQVEWTFPFVYKRCSFDRVMPETCALMRLIDETRPALLCSLHNGEYGGVFYYLSRASPQLCDTLRRIPGVLGLPLHSGEPEAPFIGRFAPSVFETIKMREAYDYLENSGVDPAQVLSGDSSAAYGDRYGALTLVSEVPYWAHPDADDQSPSGQPYGELLHGRAVAVRRVADLLAGTFDAVLPDLRLESPFRRASVAFIPGLGALADQEFARAVQVDSGRPATVAERFSGDAVLHSIRLRFGGMLLRLLDEELTRGNASQVIRGQHAALSLVFDGWADEAETTTTPDAIPIGKLVAVQYCAILAAAAHVSAGG